MSPSLQPDKRPVVPRPSLICLAFLVAGYALFRKRLPFKRLDFTGGFSRVLKPLRMIHSGSMCDYVAWLTFGVAVFGGLFALFIH
jgi:hypothetical protein